MAKVLIGNFKGPKGNDGQKGNKGEKGETGQRGSRWSEGTAITGTSTTATIFSGSGITDALVNDVYLNTSTGNVYRCTVAGAAAAAKWVYVGCIKGAKGNDGKTPTVVDDMTVAFTQASSRANIATGEKMSTIMGKIKKFFADLTAPAFAQMITTKEDLLATKATGYVPDAKAVADAVTDVTSKLSSTATANGKLTDALNVNINTATGEENKPRIVTSSDTKNLPTDCSYGIREVFWSSPGYLICKITGVSVDGKSAIWMRHYSTNWESDWRRL